MGDGTDNFSTIANNTRGIVFLGTPFYGSPVAPWGTTISRMVSVIRETDTQKIKDLDRKSEKLKTLADSFASVLRQRIRGDRELRIAFFHETKKFRGALVSLFSKTIIIIIIMFTAMLQVVPEANSRIPGFGDCASINADHSSMCKFADQDSPGYQSVLAAI